MEQNKLFLKLFLCYFMSWLLLLCITDRIFVLSMFLEMFRYCSYPILKQNSYLHNIWLLLLIYRLFCSYFFFFFSEFADNYFFIIAEGSLFYPFIKLIQMNYIFSHNEHPASNEIQTCIYRDYIHR